MCGQIGPHSEGRFSSTAQFFSSAGSDWNILEHLGTIVWPAVFRFCSAGQASGAKWPENAAWEGFGTAFAYQICVNRKGKPETEG